MSYAIRIRKIERCFICRYIFRLRKNSDDASSIAAAVIMISKNRPSVICICNRSRRNTRKISTDTSSTLCINIVRIRACTWFYRTMISNILNSKIITVRSTMGKISNDASSVRICIKSWNVSIIHAVLDGVVCATFVISDQSTNTIVARNIAIIIRFDYTTACFEAEQSTRRIRLLGVTESITSCTILCWSYTSVVNTSRRVCCRHCSGIICS